MKHVIRFLDEGNKVKVTCMLRGRENARPDLAHAILQRIVKELGDRCTIESAPRREGRTVHLIISPTKKASGGGDDEGAKEKSDA
jgi:translation initiation factor IF-3